MPLDQAMLATLKSCCKDDDAFERVCALFESHVSKLNTIEATLQHTIDVLQGEVRERLEVSKMYHEKEMFFRTVFENVDAGIAFTEMTDSDYKITFANKAFCAMLGYSESELQSLAISDITHPDDFQAQLQLIRQLENREISTYVFIKRYLRKDGSMFWSRTNAFSFRDSNHRLIFMIIVHNITAEKEANEKLHQSEAQLQWLLNALPFAIAIYKNKVPIFGNSAFFSSRGLRDFNHWLEATSQELISDDYALIHPDDHQSFIANLDDYRRRVDNGELLTLERRIRRYGETDYHWYECSLFKGDYIDGEKVFVEADVPIEARKQAELALMRSEAMLSDTERLAHIGSWSVNFETEILSWSDEVFRIYEIEKSLGAPTYSDMFQSSPDAPTIMPIIKEATEKGSRFSISKRIEFADGRVKWVEVIGAPVQDEQGSLCGYSGYVRDITHEREMQADRDFLYAQLLQSQKMEAIGVLASGVAHEFNNILAGILGSAMLLKKEVAGNPKSEKRVAQIEAASGRAATIVKQMLGFARQGKMNVQTVDLRQCIADILDVFTPTLDKRIHISTDFKVDDATCFVQGDKGQLEQVILNLAVNARDALMETLSVTTHAEISFTLACETPPKSLATEAGLPSDMPALHLAVRDSGVGIPKEVQSRIFEPFFTTKEVGKGTGLGLSMVYGIVKKHQGIISVESSVGKGTTFHLYFPLSDKRLSDKRSAEFNDKGSPNVAGAIKGTILVVDDEPLVREFLTELLEEHGYFVYSQSNGKDGLALFEAHQGEIDLVVVDKNMPELNGEQFILQLKSLRSNLRIILITGHLENDNLAVIVEKSAYKVFTKPFEPKAFLAAVASALQLP